MAVTGTVPPVFGADRVRRLRIAFGVGLALAAVLTLLGVASAATNSGDAAVGGLFYGSVGAVALLGCAAAQWVVPQADRRAKVFSVVLGVVLAVVGLLTAPVATPLSLLFAVLGIGVVFLSLATGDEEP